MAIQMMIQVIRLEHQGRPTDDAAGPVAGVAGAAPRQRAPTTRKAPMTVTPRGRSHRHVQRLPRRHRWDQRLLMHQRRLQRSARRSATLVRPSATRARHQPEERLRPRRRPRHQPVRAVAATATARRAAEDHVAEAAEAAEVAAVMAVLVLAPQLRRVLQPAKARPPRPHPGRHLRLPGEMAPRARAARPGASDEARRSGVIRSACTFAPR